jgi:hypothetical protein
MRLLAHLYLEQHNNSRPTTHADCLSGGMFLVLLLTPCSASMFAAAPADTHTHASSGGEGRLGTSMVSLQHRWFLLHC